MAKTTTKTVKKTATTTATTKDIDFEFYAPAAKEVGLAGSFNNWDSKKNPLKKDAKGTWRTKISLRQGRYEFRYQVDGSWENDQRSSIACIPNSFGSWNCVIEVL